MFEEMTRKYVDRVNRNITYFICSPNVSGKQQHFYINNGKLEHYFRGDSIFFSDKIEVSEALTSPLYTRLLFHKPTVLVASILANKGRKRIILT